MDLLCLFVMYAPCENNDLSTMMVPLLKERTLPTVSILLLLLLLLKIRTAIEAGFIIGSGQQQVA